MAEINSPGYVEATASSKRKTKEDLRIDQLIPSEILESSGDQGIKQLLEKYYEFMNLNEFIYDEQDTHFDIVLDGIARFRVLDPDDKNNRFFTDEQGANSELTIKNPAGILPAVTTFNGSDSQIVDTTNDTIKLTEFQQEQMPVGTEVEYETTGSVIGGLTNHNHYYIAYSTADKIKLASNYNDAIAGTNIINLTAVGGGTDHIIKGVSDIIAVPLDPTNVAISNGNELPGSLRSFTSEIGKTYTVNQLTSFNGMEAYLKTNMKNWVGPGPSYILNSIEQFMDIDLVSGTNEDASHDYLEMMQKEIASAIPGSLLVNKNTLYKRIIDFYKIRGSQDSIETFFRLLFNESVEVERPYDNTLIPSSGDWQAGTNQFVSTKGFVSEKKIRLHDNYRYQKYSYLIKTGKNLTDWEYTFNRLVHPAGFIFFGEILILIQMLRNARLAHRNYLRTGIGSPSKGVTKEVKNLETGLIENQLINVYGKATSILSSMPGLQPGIIGAEDLPLLIELFVSQFGPSPVAKIARNAVLSPVISGGAITEIEIVKPGYGYTSPPTLTITGNGTGATATAVLASDGSIDSITVSGTHSGYTEAAVTAAAPSIGNGKLSTIEINTLSNNVYREPPTIILGAPTARDEDGVLLSTNVQATAVFTMESTGVDVATITGFGQNYTSEPTVLISLPQSGSDRAVGRASINNLGQVDGIRIIHPGSGYTSPPTIQISDGGGSGATAKALLIPVKLTGINITNRGNGYILDPAVRLSSSMVTERRAKQTGMYLKLMLNHLVDGSRTIEDNNYFNLKGNSYYNSNKRFGLNQTIEQFGSQTIQSNNINSINSFNINSFPV